MSVNSESEQQQAEKPLKKTPNDFIFGKVIGEGSFSTVSFTILVKGFLITYIYGALNV